MKTFIKIAFSLFWGALAQCQQDEPGSESKFVPLSSDMYSSSQLLISKVHQNKWMIHYGYSDNDRCNKAFDIDRNRELQNKMSEALRIWLAPLKDVTSKPVVDKFEYKTSRMEPAPQMYGEYLHGMSKPFSFKEEDVPDFAVAFTCDTGRSHYSNIDWKKADGSEGGSVGYIRMFMPEQEDKKNVAGAYNFRTLVHEFGHAFGLADTYLKDTELDKLIGRYIPSEDGLTRIIANQPTSIMSCRANLLAPGQDIFRDEGLPEDDRKGVQWLYRYYVSKDIGREDCPQDFVYEESTKGCRPKNTLIFAVKHSASHVELRWIIHNLKENNNLIKITEKDDTSHTALHYAALRIGLHDDSSAYDFLVEKSRSVAGFDPNVHDITTIKNDIGITPEQIKKAAENENKTEFNALYDKITNLINSKQSSAGKLKVSTPNKSNAIHFASAASGNYKIKLTNTSTEDIEWRIDAESAASWLKVGKTKNDLQVVPANTLLSGTLLAGEETSVRIELADKHKTDYEVGKKTVQLKVYNISGGHDPVPIAVNMHVPKVQLHASYYINRMPEVKLSADNPRGRIELHNIDGANWAVRYQFKHMSEHEASKAFHNIVSYREGKTTDGKHTKFIEFSADKAKLAEQADGYKSAMFYTVVTNTSSAADVNYTQANRCPLREANKPIPLTKTSLTPEFTTDVCYAFAVTLTK